jgi:FkbM family methyltransferase
MNPALKKASLLLNELIFKTKSTPIAIAVKTIFPFGRQIIDSKHGKFWVDPLSHFGYFIIRDGEYEPKLSEVVERNIFSGNTVIDVGAHEGYFSILAARAVGPRGRVIALEPQSRARAVLVRNLELNSITNVTVLPYAVSDHRSKEKFYLAEGHNTGASGFANISRLPVKTEDVETATLSDVARKTSIQSADFIKMDIEGFEYSAILGSRDLFLSGFVKHLIVELHGNHIRKMGKDPADISRFLEQSGFALDLDQSDNLDTHYATLVYRWSKVQ